MNLNNTPIVFLDIDGVLQMFSSKKRFEVHRKALREEIAKKYQDNVYLQIDEYDIAAVAVDWNLEAVENIRTLVEKTGAKIVLSTGWKDMRSYEEMLRLFRIHNLDSYIIGQTRIISGIYSSPKKNDYDYIAYADYESQAMLRVLERYEEYKSYYKSWEEYIEKDKEREEKWPEYKYSYHNRYFVSKLLKQRSPDYRYYMKEDIKQFLRTFQERENMPQIDCEIGSRAREILEYVIDHNVKNFVAIDDIYMEDELGKRAIRVSGREGYFNKELLNKALGILEAN